MYWYVIENGHLYLNYALVDPNCYAGNGPHKNDPDSQSVHDHGPLPCGDYLFGQMHDSTHVGKDAIPLIPDAANQMFGRSDFYCHGDNAADPGNGSDGCIVAAHTTRMSIVASGDKLLRVVARMTDLPDLPSAA